MAKTKKVSVNVFEKIVKENLNNTITEEWFGVPVTITRTISLKDMMSLVAEVADNCFLEDGRYVPEVMQALLDCGVVERYTNISLPSNLSARYELVTKSGVLDFILPKINSNQYNDIVVAVRDKVDYLCDANVAELHRAMDKMVDSMNKIQESTEIMFSSVSPEAVKAITEAVADEHALEERIVDEYLKKKNAPLKIIGDK